MLRELKILKMTAEIALGTAKFRLDIKIPIAKAAFSMRA